MTANPHNFLQTAYQHVFTNLSLVSYTTVCSYHSLKENCVNATELPFNTLRNFVCCLAIYRLCSRIFFGWTKLRRKIALCSSELSLYTLWNFMWTFERTFVEKSREQRTKFAHFACITFAQYCICCSYLENLCKLFVTRAILKNIKYLSTLLPYHRLLLLLISDKWHSPP